MEFSESEKTVLRWIIAIAIVFFAIYFVDNYDITYVTSISDGRSALGFIIYERVHPLFGAI